MAFSDISATDLPVEESNDRRSVSSEVSLCAHAIRLMINHLGLTRKKTTTNRCSVLGSPEN